MSLSCPLGISRFVPAKAKFFGVIFWPYNKSFITKLVWSRWLDIGLVLFFAFVSVHKNAKKKLGQYPAYLDRTSLVNNAYEFASHSDWFIGLYVSVVTG